MTNSFNLINDPWITCIDLNGHVSDYSIRDVLINAHDLREVYDSSPLVIASMMKLLLAILHRVFGPENVEAWSVLWQAGQFSAEPLSEYFNTWEERFWLYHEDETKRRLYQWPVEHDGDPASPPHIVFSQGNSPSLFNHVIDNAYQGEEAPSMAKFIITAQKFRLGGRAAGIPKSIKAAPCVNTALFFFSGRTLFETFSLNLVRYPNSLVIKKSPDDRPHWEMDNPFEIERKITDDGVIPLGYLDYLTWMHLKLWLGKPTNGLFRTIKADVGIQPLHSEVRNPMGVYTKGKNGYRQQRLNLDRQVWRNSETIFQAVWEEGHVIPPAGFSWIAELLSAGYLDDLDIFPVDVVGMQTGKWAGKFAFESHQHLRIPPSFLKDPSLTEQLSEGLKDANTVCEALRKAAKLTASLFLSTTANDSGGLKPDKADVKKLIQHWGVERTFWGELEPHFYEMLYKMPDDVDKAFERWVQVLRQQAWKSYQSIEAHIGTDVRGLKAVTQGRQRLGALLKDVFKTIEEETV